MGTFGGLHRSTSWVDENLWWVKTLCTHRLKRNMYLDRNMVGPFFMLKFSLNKETNVEIFHVGFRIVIILTRMHEKKELNYHTLNFVVW